MKKLILAITLVIPAAALAANPVINELRADTNESAGQQRICVKSYELGSEFKCSKPFTKNNALLGKIFEKHKKAGLKLPFSSTLTLNDFTIEKLDAAITAAAAPAPAPAVATEPAATDKICLVDNSELLQETLKKESGEAYITRSIRFTNLRLPGSTNVNASLKFSFSGNSGQTANYSKKGNYKLDSSKTITLSTQAPSNKFEGPFLPETMKVAISNDSDGKVVSSYVCKVQVNPALTTGEEIPALATGTN